MKVTDKKSLTETGHAHFLLDPANSVYSVVSLVLNFSGHVLSLLTVIRTAENKIRNLWNNWNFIYYRLRIQRFFVRGFKILEIISSCNV